MNPERPDVEKQLRRQIARLEQELRREQTARELAEASARRAWALGRWCSSRLDRAQQPDSG